MVSTSELVDLVVRDYEIMGRKSVKSVRARRGHLERLISNPLDLDQIDEYILTRREEGAANGSIKNELLVLRRGLRLAFERGKIPSIPPVRFPKVRNVRTQCASAEDIYRLLQGLEVLDPHVADLVAWLSFVGWRRSEAQGMTWADVSPGFDRVTLADTKNDTPREIALGEAPKAILRKRWACRRGPHVFHRRGQPIRTFKGSWKRMVDAIGVPDLRPHDLRRSFAQMGLNARTPVPVLMKSAGWTSMAAFLRYGLVDQKAVSEAHDEIARQVMDS